MKDRFDVHALFGKRNSLGFIQWLREVTHGPLTISESRVASEAHFTSKPKKILKKSGKVNWVA